MKVLHVITSMSTGGAEHLLVDLLPRLTSLGNEVDLLVFDGTETPFMEQIEKKRIGIISLGVRKSPYSPSNLLSLRKFVGKYDVIHTHNTPCQLAAAIASYAKKGTKFVTTEHSSNNRRRKYKMLKFIDKWLCSRYDKIVCISDQTQVNLEERVGQRPNITTIYNGIDVDAFYGDIRAVEQGQSVIVTMSAAFRPGKDQDSIVRALTVMPQRFRARFIGDGERRNEIETLARELGVRDRTEFLGLRSDVPDLLRQSDIVVLSSHWEGLSLSSLEGMASGCPFVASDVDGLREIVSGNGLLFEDGNHHQLAEILQKLADDSALYVNTAKKCQQKAKQYDIAKMAEQYNNVYQNLR